MDNPKAQIVERIKQANNVLVTVSSSPSVDQLAAAIGLTILINKLGKHATAVFSGAVPSTMEFLEPEKTIEKNTDSLRDFIIALDKSKADKLRYKVEENVVKIFITPYRTSISEKDLDFSQGDFNVDIVIALGVAVQTDLDQAITAHGRILHDATVISINNGPGGELGSIHWLNAAASSLSEMVSSLSDDLGKDMLDSQIATALLTGIVAQTDRFSNEKTTPTTMSVSAALMTAGANQQLVATKLQEPLPSPEVKDPDRNSQQPPAGPGDSLPPVPPDEPPKTDDGTIEIDHENENGGDKESKPLNLSQIHVDDQGNLHTLAEPKPQQPEDSSKEPPSSLPAKQAVDTPRLVTQPPSLGGTLTANSRPQDLEPTTDAMSLPPVDTPFLSRDADNGIKDSTPSEAKAPLPTTFNETLSQLEQQIGSPHSNQPQPVQPPAPSNNVAPLQPPNTNAPQVDQARGAVNTAVSSDPDLQIITPQQPLQALNFDMHDKSRIEPISNQAAFTPHQLLGNDGTPQPPTDQFPGSSMNMPLPSAGYSSNMVSPSQAQSNQQTTDQINPMSPPPVPPPMVPFPTPPPTS
jgi:hypothetical protein